VRKLFARLILWAIKPELDRREAGTVVTAVKLANEGVGARAVVGRQYPSFDGLGGIARS
jgi:hypothetical protein